MSDIVRCPYCGWQVRGSYLREHLGESQECRVARLRRRLWDGGLVTRYGVWDLVALNDSQKRALLALLEAYKEEHPTGYDLPGWERPARVYNEPWYSRRVVVVLAGLLREVENASSGEQLYTAVKRVVDRYVDQQTKRLTPEGEALYILLTLEGESTTPR